MASPSARRGRDLVSETVRLIQKDTIIPTVRLYSPLGDRLHVDGTKRYRLMDSETREIVGEIRTDPETSKKIHESLSLVPKQSGIVLCSYDLHKTNIDWLVSLEPYNGRPAQSVVTLLAYVLTEAEKKLPRFVSLRGPEVHGAVGNLRSLLTDCIRYPTAVLSVFFT